MARRKPRPPRRDVSHIPNRLFRDPAYIPDPEPILTRLPSVFPSVVRALIPEIADDRIFDPDAGRSSGGRSSRRTHTYHPTKSTKATRGHSYELNFVAPKYVVQCVRRKQRQEVLFAKKLTGKGAAQKHRRRNAWSSVRC